VGRENPLQNNPKSTPHSCPSWCYVLAAGGASAFGEQLNLNAVQ